MIPHGRAISESRYALIKGVGCDVHSIRQFPSHFSYRASPCAITVQLDSTVASVHNDFLSALSIKPKTLHTVRMDNSRIRKKVLDVKLHGRRHVERPRLRRLDQTRMDFLLLLNIR